MKVINGGKRQKLHFIAVAVNNLQGLRPVQSTITLLLLIVQCAGWTCM